MTVRVGLLVDSPKVQRWQADAIQQLQSDESVDCEITLIVQNTNSATRSRAEQIQSVLAHPSLWKVLVFTGIVSNNIMEPPWYRQDVPLDDYITTREPSIVKCAPLPSEGIGNELPEVAISALDETDIAVRFGFGILQGEVLTAPSYGILSYHHGDLRQYRGRPAGFYEFLHSESTAGVTIQKLEESLDTGSIAALTHCDIRHTKSWRATKEKLFSVSPPLLPKAVLTCINGELQDVDQIGELYSTPNNRQVLNYLRKRIWQTIKR